MIGWFGGDPHFTTLDDFTYTFNGIGEYVLLRTMGEVNVEFQGRTALVRSSNATVFSAFAIQHEDITVQVHHLCLHTKHNCSIKFSYFIHLIYSSIM